MSRKINLVQLNKKRNKKTKQNKPPRHNMALENQKEKKKKEKKRQHPREIIIIIIKEKKRQTPSKKQKLQNQKKKEEGGNRRKPMCTVHGQFRHLPLKFPLTQFSPYFWQNFLVGPGRKHSSPTIFFPSPPSNQTSSKKFSLIFSPFFFPYPH